MSTATRPTTGSPATHAHGQANAQRLSNVLDTPVTLVIIVAAAVIVGSQGSAVLDRVVVAALVNLIIVVGLYVYIGLSGILSFGQIAFMALGAYTAAIVAIPVATKSRVLDDLPGPLATIEGGSPAALLAASLAGAVGALVIGILITRLSPSTVPLGTFAILIVVNVVARNWDQVTQGSSGIGPIPRTTTAVNAFALCVVVIAVSYAFQRSRYGLWLRASRDDEVAAQAAGIPVGRIRLAAFTLSGAIVGLGGGAFALNSGSFSPDSVYLTISFFALAMLIVGGIHSLSGAVVGALAIAFIGELLRRIEQGVDFGPIAFDAKPGLRSAGLAIVLLAILLLRPEGLTNGRELGFVALSRRARRRLTRTRAERTDKERDADLD